MNISDIKQLVEIIKENDLVEFELDEADFSIRVRRGGNDGREFAVAAPANMIPVHASGAPAPVAAAPVATPAPDAEVGIEIIKSPMVGSFYRAPSPESEPFVTEGKNVSSDTIVCIIEAMKVMNEIQAEISGTIVDVLVKDGDAVEFGQPLFKVKV